MSGRAFEQSKVVNLAAHRRKIEVIRSEQQLCFDLGFVDPEETRDEFFMSPVFMFQACLPLRAVKRSELIDGDWVRNNANQRIECKIRSSMGPDYLPYGKFPRHFLMWLGNAVKKFPQALSDEGHFSIDGSFRAFCQSVGVDGSTGKRGSGRALIEQVQRLMSCSFLIRRVYDAKDKSGKLMLKDNGEVMQRMSALTFAISTKMDLSWDTEKMRPAQWLDSQDGYFKLSLDFCQELRTRAMPINRAHLSALCRGRSSMRIDVYHFIVHRNWSMHHYRKPAITMLWAQLFEHFGSVGSRYDFIRSFREELRWIHANLWPELRYNDADESRMTLLRSVHPTAIRKAGQNEDLAAF